MRKDIFLLFLQICWLGLPTADSRDHARAYYFHQDGNCGVTSPESDSLPVRPRVVFSSRGNKTSHAWPFCIYVILEDGARRSDEEALSPLPPRDSSPDFIIAERARRCALRNRVRRAPFTFRDLAQIALVSSICSRLPARTGNLHRW